MKIKVESEIIADEPELPSIIINNFEIKILMSFRIYGVQIMLLA